MDAYDIFKKLSRGCTFTRKPKVPQAQATPAPVIKQESIEKVVVKKDSPEAPLTLLSSLSNEPRGKKRKLPDVETVERKKKLLKEEEVNRYRNENKINVVGKKVPDPARNFTDLNIESDLVENLKQCDYEEPTPVQKQAIPIMLEGRHLLACAPTGSGKTAAFLVPIIHDLKGPQKKGFRALVLCPTRELAKQTQRECVRLSEGRGLHVHVINKINQALTQYGPSSSQKFDILITTPNRLCFLLKQEPAAISLKNVEWLVIDEADKLFETGNRGFREQLAEVLNACTNQQRKIAMFSATYTPVVAKWCVHNMKGLVRITIGHRNTAVDLVEQQLLFVGNEQGKLIGIRDIIRQGMSPPVLIFVQSKDRAQQLFQELIYDGIMVDAIHADRTQLQRDNTVKAFREGKIWVLICTELMARGIDFKGVNLVINYDFPPSAISYVHRIGRAGRAGRTGKAITFFTTDDTANLRSIATIMKESGAEVPEYIFSMKKKGKRERKQVEKVAPKRDDISTRPKYEILKMSKRRKGKEGADKKENLKVKTSDGSKMKNKNKAVVVKAKQKLKKGSKNSVKTDKKKSKQAKVNK